ncbi:Flagellar M-ring protein [Bordetella parapertussis]|nr:Flagellar M-ring protein [Bordetella parapertussis]SUV58708.1 Flagellar M-ring protein [Bordetella parapertussis]SUV79240.1 flagellar M-ring protein [Bordetella parapertussis]VEF52598.1 Flagellar M-ring protein [Bordetella parapertussis]VTR30401.1 Flagellar M-ring protein [Bordetella parapertussis]
MRSQQTSDSRQTGPNAAQGVPGALSNQPPANAQAPIVNPPAVAGTPQQQQQQRAQQQAAGATTTQTQPGAAAPSNDRHDATINYEVDRTISHVKQPVSMLKRLSVAVVVNYLPNKEGESEALPPEELNKLTNLVREAMGYSEARGDSLNLVNSQFNDTPVAVPLWRDPELIAMIKTALGWMFGLILAFWLYRKIRPVVTDYFYPQVDPEVAAAQRQEAEREAQAAARTREVNRYKDNLQLARDMAGKDPRAVAMVLRSWMSKDEK